MLYGKILGSPIAAGTLKSLDTKAAEALKGVAAVHVMTEPGKPINWAGQEIVAIAAETEEIAVEAIRLVKAEYERGKPQVDDTDLAKAEGRPRTRTDGDPEKAFAEAAATVSGRYGVAMITHCCLEPHGQVSEFGDGALKVWPSTQNVSGYAGQLAQAVGLGSQQDSRRLPVHGRRLRLEVRPRFVGHRRRRAGEKGRQAGEDALGPRPGTDDRAAIGRRHLPT